MSFRCPSSYFPMGAAGFPRTTVEDGTSRLTTLPAATNEWGPISTPGKITAPAAIQLPERIVIGRVTKSKVSERKSCEPVQR